MVATKNRHADEDKRALKYAGMMGHTVCVVKSDKDGRRMLSVQCSTVADAKRFIPEAAIDPVIYQRSANGNSWRRVAK